ncbi:winged helix-turn-helix domain-containing protein [Rheinheimera gaetbuli]
MTAPNSINPVTLIPSSIEPTAQCQNQLLQPCWQLGVWYIEPGINRISSEECKLQLEPRLMTTLLLLLRANGQTVSDEQLLNNVWPNVVVSDASLYQVIAQLRKALTDQQKPYQLIERVQRKGYRLLQHASMLPPPNTAISQHSPQHTPAVSGKVRGKTRTNRAIFAAVTASCLALYVISLAFWHDEQIPVIYTPLTAAPVTSQQPLLPYTGFEQHDWSTLQQARYLLNQPQAAAISDGISYLHTLLPQYQHHPALLVALCNGYHAMHTYSDWSLQKALALCEPLLQQALKLQPDFAPALGSFGALQLSRNNLDGARFYLDKAGQLAPEDTHIMLWRAALHRVQGQYDKAIELMDKATKLAPLSGLLKRHYAYSLLGDGQLSRARVEFRHALLLEDNYSDRALDELELLPLTRQRALAFLLWAERFPDRLHNPERWTQLSLVQLSLQQIKQAEASLQQATLMSDKHPFVLLAQAMLAQAQGQDAIANAYLQQRLSLNPQHKIFQLQAMFLSAAQATTAQRSVLHKLLPAYFQDADQALQHDLANNEQINALYFLLSLPQTERQTYQSHISDFVSSQQNADSLSLQLLSVVGLTEQANQLALHLLDNGWLPSPHDDYYLAEQHPLWQQLSVEFFSKLQQQRQQVLDAFAAEMAEIKPNEVPQ